MREADAMAELENALQRLMPSGISEGFRTETETMLDELANDARLPALAPRTNIRRISGIAAAFAVFCVAGFFVKRNVSDHVSAATGGAAPDLVSLAESDRIERVSDEGLFVDAGGSAVRKLRVRVIEESQMRDEETGIVFSVSEPREEMYLLPVSNF